MKLWLDDKRPMPDGWDKHVKTYQDAVNCIETGKVTHIGFDHDLGDETDLEIRNGYEVSKYIEDRAHDGCIPRIIWSIQSDNGPGRLRIEAAMKSADKFWDIHENKLDEDDISQLEVFHGYIEYVDEKTQKITFRFHLPSDIKYNNPMWAEFNFNEVPLAISEMPGYPAFWIRDFSDKTEKLIPKVIRYTKEDQKRSEKLRSEWRGSTFFD